MFNVTHFKENVGVLAGMQILWHLPEAKYEKAKIVEVLERVGLQKELARDISLKTATLRTAKDVAGLSYMAQTIKDGEMLVVSVLEKDVDVAGETMSMEQGTKVILDKGAMRVQATGARADAFHAKLSEYQSNLTSADIRSIIVHVIGNCRGVKMRHSGGVYFVPKQFVDVVSALDEFMTQANVGYLVVTGVMNEQVARDVAWDAAELEIVEKLEAIETSLSKMNKRAGCAVKQHDKVSEVKELLDTYKELQAQESVLTNLQGRIAETEKRINDKVQELNGLKAQKAA